MTKEIRTALIGLGNVGRSFLTILESKQGRLAEQYGLAFRIVCVADSSGVAVNPGGYEPGATRRAKENGVPVRRLAGYWPGVTPGDALAADLECDLVLEASPVNLKSGEPGLSAVRMALMRGVSVVLANKGPLVLAFPELKRLARENGAGLAYSATVCGALPVVNVGTRDLIAADIQALRGIFNSTSNFILGEMAAGKPYVDALAEAQRRGLAETDPSLDVEGWDTANKLVIIANSVLGRPTTLDDVAIEGIRHITLDALREARASGRVIKPLALATWSGDDYALRVGPVALPGDHPLARTGMWDMGVVYTTDYMGVISAVIEEKGPVPTSAAVLRDMINIYAA